MAIHDFSFEMKQSIFYLLGMIVSYAIGMYIFLSNVNLEHYFKIIGGLLIMVIVLVFKFLDFLGDGTSETRSYDVTYNMFGKYKVRENWW